jgi:2-keto-3-deoxy-L-rhamnonate aldolase RhmA
VSPSLKERIALGEPVIGTWLSLASVPVAEILASMSFDFMVIDVEHGATTFQDVQDLIRVISAAGVVPLVRVSQNDEIEIRRVMDLGATGVIVPMVKSGDQARAAVLAVQYPPRGMRGVSLCRANAYGDRFHEYLEQNANESIVVVQVEHRQAIENLDDILSVEGVDASIIGPYDLSGSYGTPGAFDDPRVEAALESYEEVSRARGIPMGYHVVDPDPSRVMELTARGYCFVAFGADFVFVQHGANAPLRELRESVPLPRNSP